MALQQRQLPDRHILSMLVGMILLSYSLTHFVSIPARKFELVIAGVYLPIVINFSTLNTLLVAGLTASGSAWLINQHPAAKEKRTLEHGIIPSLSSLVLMAAIEQLPFGPVWWAAALGSGLALALILIAEYIILDPDHIYHLAAEIAIASLSLVLFLILAIALHAGGTRLVYRIPLISLSAVLVFIRILHIRRGQFWALPQVGVVVVLLGELAAGFHYWPLSSISYGIALLGPLYALVEFTDNLHQDPPQRGITRWLGPSLILVLSWTVAFLV